MAKKTEEAPIMRRSSYISASTGKQTPEPTPTTELPTVGSPELRQTIAEARAALTANLQAKLDEAEATIRKKQEAIDAISVELEAANNALTELKQAPRGVDSEVYEYTNDETGESYVVVQVDTEKDSGRIKVYVNDGVIYDSDPESEETADPEETPAAALVRILDEHLSTYSAGPTAILSQMERRGPIERAGYLASLDRLAAVTREKADQLDDLRKRAEIAGHLLKD